MRGLLREAGFTEVEVTARALSMTELEDANVLLIDVALAAALRQGRSTQEQVGLLRQDLADSARRGAS